MNLIRVSFDACMHACSLRSFKSINWCFIASVYVAVIMLLHASIMIQLIDDSEIVLARQALFDLLGILLVGDRREHGQRKLHRAARTCVHVRVHISMRTRMHASIYM